MLGGILQVAGVDGFLGNLTSGGPRPRTSARATGSHTCSGWLLRTFGSGNEFTCSQVRDALMKDSHSETPPGMTDLAGADSRSYNRKLGQEYARHADRWFGDVQLVKSGGKHGHVGAWMVIRPEEGEPESATSNPVPTSPDSDRGNGGNGGDPSTYTLTAENSFFAYAPPEAKKPAPHTGVTSPGVSPVSPIPPSGSADGALFPRSDTSEPARPAHLPTPAVYGGTSRPADWFDLFAADAPDLDPALCDCGTEKVPDTEMAYFLLCPVCTPGTLRPADSEV
jgi:hypothetical protein